MRRWALWISLLAFHLHQFLTFWHVRIGRRDKEEGGTRRKEGRRGRRDEEEGWTRRKDGRGERYDVEEGVMRRVKK